jgi:hypothetical protein
MPPTCRWCWTLAAGAALALGLALRLSVPAWSGWLPGCSVRQLTGWYCPGCGGTRAAAALLAFDVAAALRFNPLFVGLLGAAAFVGLRAVWRERRGRCPALGDFPARWGWWLGAAVLAFVVLRNLPWWPFSWLAPG